MLFKKLFNTQNCCSFLKQFILFRWVWYWWRLTMHHFVYFYATQCIARVIRAIAHSSRPARDFFFFTVPQTRQICQFIGILRLEWRPMCWRWRGDSNDIWVHADQYHRVTCKSMVQTSLLLAWMAALVIVESVMIIIHVHVTGMANKRNKKIIIMIMIIKHFCIVHYNTDLSCETCSWSVNGYLYIQCTISL